MPFLTLHYILLDTYRWSYRLPLFFASINAIITNICVAIFVYLLENIYRVISGITESKNMNLLNSGLRILWKCPSTTLVNSICLFSQIFTSTVGTIKLKHSQSHRWKQWDLFIFLCIFKQSEVYCFHMLTSSNEHWFNYSIFHFSYWRLRLLSKWNELALTHRRQIFFSNIFLVFLTLLMEFLPNRTLKFSHEIFLLGKLVFFFTAFVFCDTLGGKKSSVSFPRYI